MKKVEQWYKKITDCEKYKERSLTLFVPVSTGFIYWDNTSMICWLEYKAIKLLKFDLMSFVKRLQNIHCHQSDNAFPALTLKELS